MKKILEFLLQLLYPNRCVFCQKLSRYDVCESCKSKPERVVEPRCKKCGKPIRQDEAEYCRDCMEYPKSFEQGKNLWLHKSPVSDSLYRFKYKDKRRYGRYYAEELYRHYGDWIRSCGIEVIIPVPLHFLRKRRRGYNHAEIVARILGEKCDIPVQEKAVKRVKRTVAQKKLGQKERRMNLSGAFWTTESWNPKKRVLLVDDIYTTGSTLDALAKTLLADGAEKVWFLTISIGQGFR